jgi:hypothetical protein
MVDDSKPFVLTLKYLMKESACGTGLQLFSEHKLNGKSVDEVFRLCFTHNKTYYIPWLMELHDVRKSVSPDVLELMAKSGKYRLEEIAAGHHKTKPDILVDLSYSKDDIVAQIAIKNPNLPPEVRAYHRMMFAANTVKNGLKGIIITIFRLFFSMLPSNKEIK